MTIRRWWVVPGLVAALVCLLIGADETTLKSVKARDAKVAYEEAMKKAEVDYSEKVLSAKKNYRGRLEAAKAAVMQSGDLDEANKIQAELKKLDQEIKDRSQPQPVRGLVITRAKYGITNQWADVTEHVRKKNSGDAIANLTNFPDPAFGVPKIVVIEGLYAGREFVLAFDEGSPHNTLVFGVPSENLLTKIPK